jgi:hypothetical protein
MGGLVRLARRVFEALCAQYPDKYIALMQPGDAAQEQAADMMAAKTAGIARWVEPATKGGPSALRQGVVA